MDIEVIVTCVWCTRTATRIVPSGNEVPARFCGRECELQSYRQRRAELGPCEMVERIFDCAHCGTTVTREVPSRQLQSTLYCSPRCGHQRRKSRSRRERRRRESLARRDCEGCGARSRSWRARVGGLVACDDCFMRLFNSCFRKNSQTVDRAADVALKLGGSIYRCAVCTYWHRTALPQPRPEVGQMVVAILAGLSAPGAQLHGREPSTLRASYLASVHDEA